MITGRVTDDGMDWIAAINSILEALDEQTCSTLTSAES